MRTIEEAITREREKAEIHRFNSCNIDTELYADDTEAIEDAKERCIKCAEEHEQLAEWLEELKAYREIGTVEECKESVLDIEKAYNKGYADGSLSVTSEIRNEVIDECLGVLYRNARRCYEEIFKEMEKLKE